MTISVDWATRVINVPRTDLTLIQASPIEIRELDINAFRLILRALEADETGMPFPHTHDHNAPVPLASFDVPRVVQLVNGYTITFEDGQYVVSVAGGNHNIGARRNPNQVSLSENLSAGLVQSRDIEYLSFNGGVTIDTVNGVGGTVYPTGTIRQPVNNLDDALLIAAVRGLPNFYLLSDISITSGSLHARNFIAGIGNVTVTVGPGAALHHSRIVGAIVTGNISSPSVTLERCRVENITYSGEFMYSCALRGTITLTGAGPITFAQCMDDDSSSATPTVDMTSFTGDLAMRDWFGGVKFVNKTAAGAVAIDLRGRVELASTVTNGSFIVRGIGHIVDDSVGATVDAMDLLTNSEIAQAVLADPRALTVGKFMGLKDA